MDVSHNTYCVDIHVGPTAHHISPKIHPNPHAIILPECHQATVFYTHPYGTDRWIEIMKNQSLLKPLNLMVMDQGVRMIYGLEILYIGHVKIFQSSNSPMVGGVLSRPHTHVCMVGCVRQST